VSLVAEIQKPETKVALSQLDQLKNLQSPSPTARPQPSAIRAAGRDNESPLTSRQQMPEYKSVVEKAIADAKKTGAGKKLPRK
jgi:hypothetical protein